MTAVSNALWIKFCLGLRRHFLPTLTVILYGVRHQISRFRTAFTMSTVLASCALKLQCQAHSQYSRVKPVTHILQRNRQNSLCHVQSIFVGFGHLSLSERVEATLCVQPSSSCAIVANRRNARYHTRPLSVRGVQLASQIQGE